jgi:carbonic anhydrase/acetyltransferase-like protein (isoleucine patch superfamily)
MYEPQPQLPLIQAFDGYVPQIAEGVYIAPNAAVVGNVILERDVTIWFGAVLRGDIGSIRVGERSTIQDLCCLHTKKGGPVVDIGRDVHVGHGCIIHGATIKDGAYLGNGVLVLDGAEIGEQSVVSAGALVARDVVIPPKSLVRGRPAKIIRQLTEAELSTGSAAAEHQMALGRKARGIPFAGEEE